MIILALIFLFVSAVSPALTTADCDVQIIIQQQSFETSSLVKPKLLSTTIDTIWLPHLRPRGYKVHLLDSDFNSSDASQAQLIHYSRRDLEPGLSVEMAIDGLIGLGWERVGIPTSDGDYTVEPGTYQVSLLFSPFDFANSREKTIPLCEVYSQPFEIRTAQSWTIFR